VLETECWLWTGAKNNQGYPQKRHNGRTQYLHRLSYVAMRGPIPEGLELDHLCRTPPCYNPLHLEAATHLENMRRGIGNQHRGKTHCLRGHPFTATNTRIGRRGERNCRPCGLIRGRRSYWLRRRGELPQPEAVPA